MAIKQVEVPIDSEGWKRDYKEILAELDAQQPDSNHDTVQFIVHEGVSLVETGVLEMIKIWQRGSGFTDDQIEVMCHNTVEDIPFHNFGFGPCILNEATAYSKYVQANITSKRFGLFVGRITLARLCMMYHMHTHWPNHSVLSMLNDNNANKKYLPGLVGQPWIDLVPCTRDIKLWYRVYPLEKIQQWFTDHKPASIDNRSWHEQYSGPENSVMQSLVEHYDKFCIELVAETMNYGDTFWVTEKMGRPLVTGKPFLVFGTKNFLQRLRQLGFRTFNSIWDESYDNYEGVRRWMVMRDVLQYLADLNAEKWKDVISQANAIAVENFQHYKETFPREINDPWINGPALKTKTKRK